MLLKYSDKYYKMFKYICISVSPDLDSCIILKCLATTRIWFISHGLSKIYLLYYVYIT